MSSQVQIQTANQIKVQQRKRRLNIYFSQDDFAELSIGILAEHVKEALDEAETIISKGFLSMDDVKKIIEEKVKEKLEKYQDIKSIEYWFDEGVTWEEIDVGGIRISRAYNAIDELTVAIANGPEIMFDVHADYVVVEVKGEEHVVYFRINNVELDSVKW
jgi:hypothetical protein